MSPPYFAWAFEWHFQPPPPPHLSKSPKNRTLDLDFAFPHTSTISHRTFLDRRSRPRDKIEKAGAISHRLSDGDDKAISQKIAPPTSFTILLPYKLALSSSHRDGGVLPYLRQAI
jgi:hypothetical protein